LQAGENILDKTVSEKIDLRIITQILER